MLSKLFHCKKKERVYLVEIRLCCTMFDKGADGLRLPL